MDEVASRQIASEAIADCKAILDGLDGRMRYHAVDTEQTYDKPGRDGRWINVVPCDETDPRKCDLMHIMIKREELSVGTWYTWVLWSVFEKRRCE